MYELIMFFIERSGGNLKPIQTRDPKVLKLPDNLYEHRFHQCEYVLKHYSILSNTLARILESKLTLVLD